MEKEWLWLVDIEWERASQVIADEEVEGDAWSEIVGFVGVGVLEPLSGCGELGAVGDDEGGIGVEGDG